MHESSLESSLVQRIASGYGRACAAELRAANHAAAAAGRAARHAARLAEQARRAQRRAEHTAGEAAEALAAVDLPDPALDRLLGDLAAGDEFAARHPEDNDPVERNDIDDARTPAEHAAAVRAYEYRHG